MEFDQIKHILAQELPPARYQHTLRVVDTAGQLAAKYQVNEAQAKLAALLHDCARGYRDAELLTQAKMRGIVVDEIHRHMPVLLHAPVGAILAQEVFGVEDAEIIQAIAVHTVGAADMGPVAKVVFIADAIEPGRSYAGVKQLINRVAGAGKNLDRACLHCLDYKIQVVVKFNYLLHPGAVAARNQLILNLPH